MAVVMKRDTIAQKQREDAMIGKEKLEHEIKSIIQENKEEIRDHSIKWMLILGIGLFFIFPVGFVIGWFVGREMVVRRLIEYHRLQIIQINKRIKIQKGEVGENKVSQAIESQLSNDYFLMNDLVIPNGRNGTQIDHVLIGPDKIYCIETKNITGKFYPHREGWLWYPMNSRGNIRKKIIAKNPQHQSIYHAKHLRKLLENRGYTVEIIPTVIMTNPSGKWMGRQDEKCPIYNTIKEFIERTIRLSEVKVTNATKEKIVSLLIDTDERHRNHFYRQFVDDTSHPQNI